jgi:pimeloyl-ACP methyl ester carboxylesterase
VCACVAVAGAHRARSHRARDEDLARPRPMTCNAIDRRKEIAMIRVKILGVVLGLVSCAEPPPGGTVGSAPALTTSDVSFTVAVRGTGSATLHASVYSNPRARHGANVLALHGFTTTGFTFAPLAQAMFDDPILGLLVRRVIAVDLPGHGGSDFPASLPAGVRFGDLNVDDDVDLVVQSIDALRDLGLAPSVIIGHSAGGLELQAAQELLLARHSSLAAHGVLGAVLLAPVPPHGQPWQTGMGSGDPTQFIVDDPALGTYFLLTPEAWIPGLFGTLSTGALVPGTPTPDEVTDARYIGPEPLAAVLQLAEFPPPGGTTVVPRPSVRAGAFASGRGTLLTLVAFREDATVRAADLANLYEYLTGDNHDWLDRVVTTPDTVHAMYVSNPEGVLDALRPML